MSQTAKLYGVGILGNCCTHGEFVAFALKQEPQAKIIAGWEDDPRRSQGLAGSIGLELAASAEALLNNREIDIIALACSPHQKAAWVEKAAQAGKHIFLNKPMAESLDSAHRIEQAIKDYPVQLVYDIPVIARFHPLTAKILGEVRAGQYGRPLNYIHSFSFTFSTDFPLALVWPERLDPPSFSGGGELTNLGCYAIDYMIALWGQPHAIQAKLISYWDMYRQAQVENFGQVIADYGHFFAVIAAGKQPLPTLPSMDVAEALNTRNWHNLLELQFEGHNLTVMPFHNLFIHNGRKISIEDYLAGYSCPTPFQQLVQAIETGQPPDSSAGSGRLSTEVLMAAYQSAKTGGQIVSLPLADGSNPLI
ncbi:MAG: Gfo/Idh/MocA family oxidoreductase [Anaerolineae bacterium]